jgi:hypothetical protein
MQNSIDGDPDVAEVTPQSSNQALPGSRLSVAEREQARQWRIDTVSHKSRDC